MANRDDAPGGSRTIRQVVADIRNALTPVQAFLAQDIGDETGDDAYRAAAAIVRSMREAGHG